MRKQKDQETSQDGLFTEAPAAKRWGRTHTPEPAKAHQMMDLGDIPSATYSDGTKAENEYPFGQASFNASTETSAMNLGSLFEPKGTFTGSEPVADDDFNFEAQAAQIVHQSESRLKRRKALAIALGVAGALVVGAVVSGVVLGGPESTVDPVSVEDVVNSPDSWFTQVAQAEPSEAPLKLAAGMVQWSIKPKDKASFSVFGAGILGVEGATLTAYGLDGKPAATDKLEAPVEYALETRDAKGNPAVAWKSGDRLSLWSKTSGIQHWKVPADAEVSANGSGALIYQKDGKITAALPGIKALSPVAKPEAGHVVVALDASQLITVNSGERNARTSGLDGKKVHDIELAAPGSGATLSRVVGAGHGLVAALWSGGPDERIMTLGIHPLNGSKPSYLAVDASTAAATKWAVGQGMDLATYGPYAIDLDTATPTISVSAQDIVMTGALGTLPFTEDGAGKRSFVLDGSLRKSADKSLMGITSDGSAVFRLADGTIESHTDNKA